MHNPAAVVFDMDGVLVDTYRPHYRSWRQVAESKGLRLTEAEFAETFGRTSREVIAKFWTGDSLDAGAIAAIDDLKEAAFRQAIDADFPAMPGAVDLLVALREAGFKLAVGSSAPPANVDLVLEKMDARRMFGAIVTGADVSRGKPDPQVFLLAAERLGVSPFECVVVEDAPPGVAAAHAAGMMCIGLLSTGRTHDDLKAADAIVKSLDEISPAMLRRLYDRVNVRRIFPTEASRG
jgi:beta-phosphoglucomutase